MTLDQVEASIERGELLDQKSQLTLIRRLRAALAERDAAKGSAATDARAAQASSADLLDRLLNRMAL